MFGKGKNVKLANWDEFRRTGMTGAQFLEKNKIETANNDITQARRRPTTSHFRGGDRLPSRAVKTRDRSKRIHIGTRKKANRRQQHGLNKPVYYGYDSVSPKHQGQNEIKITNGNDNHRQVRQNIHTAMPQKKFRIAE